MKPATIHKLAEDAKLAAARLEGFNEAKGRAAAILREYTFMQHVAIKIKTMQPEAK